MFRPDPYLPVVEPDTSYVILFEATFGLGMGAAPADSYREMFWQDPSDWHLGHRAITCLADNSKDSVIVNMMDAGSYPTSTKTVRWFPVVGIAGISFADPWGSLSGGAFQTSYNLLKAVSALAIPGSSDFGTIDELNPSVSDWIVPDYSQCDVSPTEPLRGRSYNNTTHVEFPIPGTKAEYGSETIANDVLDVICGEASAADYYPLQ